jgi:hypothetical protein
MKSIQEIEELLGRRMNAVEKLIYDMQKENPNYHFEKDANGNLVSILNEEDVK